MSGRSSGRVEWAATFALVRASVRYQICGDSLTRSENELVKRDYIDSTRLTHLTDEVTDREFDILRSLERLRLASGRQLERLHFRPDVDRNRRRVLQSLSDRRLVARLDRTVGGKRSGSAGYVYSLDIAGRRLLSRLEGRAVRRPSTPGASFVRHILAVSELYVQLVEAERRGETELLDFQAEPAAWRRYPGRGGGTAVCKPDAYVRLGSGEYEDSWFVEVDRGTENTSRLTGKLDAYRAYWSSGQEQARRGIFPRVLWLVPDDRRYQVVVDTCGRQPADSWALHRVTLFEGGVGLMTGGLP
jgi:Replication-relaxation